MTQRNPETDPDWRDKRPARFETGRTFLHFRENPDVQLQGSAPFYCAPIEDADGLFDCRGNPNEEVIRGRYAHLRQYQGSYGTVVVVSVREGPIDGHEGPAIPKSEHLREQDGVTSHHHSAGSREVVLSRDDVRRKCEVTTYDVRPVRSAAAESPEPAKHARDQDSRAADAWLDRRAGNQGELGVLLDRHGIRRDDRFTDAPRTTESRDAVLARTVAEPEAASARNGGTRRAADDPPLQAESSASRTTIRTAPERPEVVMRRKTSGPAENEVSRKAEAERRQEAIRQRAERQAAERRRAQKVSAKPKSSPARGSADSERDSRRRISLAAENRKSEQARRRRS